MRNPLKVRCPMCEAAWTGGHPNPHLLTYCIICGEGPPMWIWRVPKVIRNMITKRRIAKVIQMMAEGKV